MAVFAGWLVLQFSSTTTQTTMAKNSSAEGWSSLFPVPVFIARFAADDLGFDARDIANKVAANGEYDAHGTPGMHWRVQDREIMLEVQDICAQGADEYIEKVLGNASATAKLQKQRGTHVEGVKLSVFAPKAKVVESQSHEGAGIIGIFVLGGEGVSVMLHDPMAITSESPPGLRVAAPAGTLMLLPPWLVYTLQPAVQNSSILVMQFIIAGEWRDTRVLPQFRMNGVMPESLESSLTAPMAFVAGAGSVLGERVFVANTTWRDAFPVYMNAIDLGVAQVNAIDFGSVVRETNAVYNRFLDESEQSSIAARVGVGVTSFFADLLGHEIRTSVVGAMGHATNDAFFRWQRLGKVWEQLFRTKGSSLGDVQRAIVDGANAYFANNPCKNLRRFQGSVTAENVRVWVALHARGSSHPPHVHVS